VFIDETWTATNMARSHGRAAKGERLRMGFPHGHRKTTTLIAGLRTSGMVAQAHRYREMMLQAGGRTILDLAREAGVGRPYFSRIVKLGFLAPAVVQALLHDRHPLDLTAKRLSLHTKLPNAWEDQVAILGIACRLS
jgi:hypothetical protein